MPDTGTRPALTGPIVAVATPFTADRLDIPVLSEYLAWLWDRGVRTILANGTTGEFFSTTTTERLAVLAECRRSFPGTVIAHVGAGPVCDVLAEIGHTQPLADYLAILPPYYYAEPPAAGVREYFRQILPRTSLPVFLYNFPRHTQTLVTPELLRQLAQEFPGLAGIKDSGKDRDISREFASTGMPVLLGDDSAAARLPEFGCQAIVTGGGSPIAEIPVAIAAALADGNQRAANDLQLLFDDWREAKHRSPLPEIAFIKAALGERIPGFPTDVRAPLVGAAPGHARQIRAQLREIMLRLAGR